MYSEIDVKVEDGNLGRGSGGTDRAQVKIGVSDAQGSVPVLVTNTMSPDEIKEKLGYSPLADACIDATENGLKTIYAIPVAADVEGGVSEVMHTGSGTGTVGVTGLPNNAYDIVALIVTAGNTNDGTFRYSIDGGNNFSDELTIPLNGEYGISGTGLTLKFTDAENGEESFAENDAYAFSTTAPTMSNASVLKAVEKLINFNKTVEVCHIVGVSGKALWAALAGAAKDFLNIYKKPMIFLCEGRACRKDEPLDEYMAEMALERKGISSLYVCVSLTYAIYQRKDLRVQAINMAGVISGLIGAAKESLSVGCVEEFPVSCAKLQKMVPEGIEAYSEQFDAMGYTVFRQYAGRDDFYVANANVMAPAGSDFPYVESVRVLNRIVREIAKQASDKIQAEVDPEDLDGSVAKIEAHLNIAMEQCERDKIISSGEAAIDTENLNILADETMDVRVAWVPMGTVRRYNLTFAVNNPASGS